MTPAGLWAGHPAVVNMAAPLHSNGTGPFWVGPCCCPVLYVCVQAGSLFMHGAQQAMHLNCLCRHFRVSHCSGGLSNMDVALTGRMDTGPHAQSSALVRRQDCALTYPHCMLICCRCSGESLATLANLYANGSERTLMLPSAAISPTSGRWVCWRLLEVTCSMHLQHVWLTEPLHWLV